MHHLVLLIIACAGLSVQAQVLVEYANRGNFPKAPYSNFFYTADPGEQALLDAGKAGAFYRTGATFNTGGSTAVCRFYGSVTPGPNSHFYTANASECSALKAAQITPKPSSTQQWNYEGDGFRVTPLTAATCPTGTTPVYRAYNNAFGNSGKQAWDSNHRLSTRLAEIETLKQNTPAWRSEGIAFCVPSSPAEANLVASDNLANYCAQVRADKSWGDKPGSLLQENQWLRSYMDEYYLWPNEIPRSPEAWYSSTDDYLNAQRTPFKTESGSMKDRYSFTMPTNDYLNLEEGIATASYGFEWDFVPGAGYSVVVTYTEPGSPAEAAGIKRGDVIVSVDGNSLANLTNYTQLLSLLYPASNGETHSFVLRRSGQPDRSVKMTSANVTVTYVQNLSTLNTSSGKVGYLLFNGFQTPAEGELVKAFTTLKNAGANDLVLDLRYNGGGSLYLSAQLGYMIAGAASVGKTFTKIQFSDKRVADNANPDNVITFVPLATGDTGSGTVANAALPTLSLKRVFIIAQYGTASASEYLINALRGIGVEVILIGGTTYGKPYGFIPWENCGTVYLV
ncbi:MAG: hypothetical protein RLZZ502_353, partial [Pseudomonadota bacterium]